jgi:hypothetical protein
MADNTLQQENKSFRTEEIGGHQVQPVKLMLGADNVDDGDVSAANQMPVIDEAILVSRGLVPGIEHVHIFGANPDIDTIAAENVWAAGGLFTFSPAAETVSIVSTAIEDNGVTPNTGARTIRVTGLDAAWAQVTEDLTLNGTTPVLTSSMTVVHRIEVLTAGATGWNEGIITGTGSDSSLTLAYIPIARNATSLGHYMVPAGKTAYLEKVILSATKAANTSALLTGEFKEFGTDNVFRPFGEIGVDEGGVVYQFTTPPSFPEKTQIKFLAEVLANNTNVSIFVELLLIDN